MLTSSSSGGGDGSSTSVRSRIQTFVLAASA
jgi:hypothetical protein